MTHFESFAVGFVVVLLGPPIFRALKNVYINVRDEFYPKK